MALEFQMALLFDHFSHAERLGRRRQQIKVEFGNRQEQRLWRLDLGVGDRAGTLLDDLAQGFAPATGSPVSTSTSTAVGWTGTEGLSLT